MRSTKILLALTLLIIIAAWLVLDLQSWFTLERFQSQRTNLLAYKQQHFWLTSILYFCVYVLVAALSIPATAIITLAGGALFGFWWGTLLSSFASSIGATLAFLSARTILGEWVQTRFSTILRDINKGIARDGVFYLLTIRLVPLFPFVIVNLLMGLTNIRPLVFYVVSQLGMLFATALFVNIGAQLGAATTLPDIFGPGVIGAIVGLAIFPWVARAAISFVRSRRRFKGL